MEEAVDILIKEIDKSSIDIRGNKEKLIQVATISANGEEKIGKLIADTISQGDENRAIQVEKNNTSETIVENLNGFFYAKGVASPVFIDQLQEGGSNTLTIENPHIAVINKHVKSFNDLIKLANSAIKKI